MTRPPPKCLAKALKIWNQPRNMLINAENSNKYMFYSPLPSRDLRPRSRQFRTINKAGDMKLAWPITKVLLRIVTFRFWCFLLTKCLIRSYTGLRSRWILGWLRLRLRLRLQKSTPTPTPTPGGSIKIHIMILKFIMEIFLSWLKRSLVCSKALRCKYALKTCRIKKQVTVNSPASASFAENVRPKQQNDLFSTKSNFERSIVN